MSLTFYCGSGSPFAWRVWLALEHKALPYDLKMLSFQAGDLRKPEYLAVNPRGRVPAIVDEGFALWESAAIVDYLEDRYAEKGAPLFPGDVRARAVARRLCRETDFYFAQAMETLVDEVLGVAPEARDATAIARASERAAAELATFDREMRGEFLAGALSAADFTLYPMIALLLRMERRAPEIGLSARLPQGLRGWMTRFEALPLYGKTLPPHWR